MRYRLTTVFALAFLLPVMASAQSIGGGVGSIDPFTISVSPQYPAPLGTVTLSFLSSSLNLESATMVVLVAGKKTYAGNVQPVTIQLGATGKVLSVVVKITAGGVLYNQSLVLQPENVSLIAEPSASAPVLYPGKPLIPLNGNTRVVAIADFKDAAGKILDPSTLSYSWMVDGANIADSSGIGRDAIIVASPLQYRERTVSVTVESQSGSFVGGDSLTLDPVAPTVYIYQNDPLLGVLFDHALFNTYAINGTESSLYAAPFSFPLLDGTPSSQWFLNGSPAQTGSVITLRPAGSGQGNASLSLTTSVGASSEAAATLLLSFGAKSGTNFFGL